MTMRRAWVPATTILAMAALAMLPGAALGLTAERHAATGVVLAVDAAHRSLTVSCAAIPGYMDAMAMPFRVRDGQALAGLKPGAQVRFTIVPRKGDLYAEDIEVRSTASFEPDPMEAGRLTALHNTLAPQSAAKVVAVGQPVPDFALTDQAGKEIRLSELRGKVVALTFGYSRCPNPNYCFRLSNNLARVEKRFHEQAGRDLVLITVVIDPEHDRGAALTEYAGAWKANPAAWHFLTGPLPEIRQVAGMFGMNFWNDEGLLTHSLHTVVIDRRGELAANLEGNEFTAGELGDLVQTVMSRN